MLPEISNVTIIRKGITRILAQNPGPFTLQGTNTYLIASEKRCVLFDTGEGKIEYLGFLESVLKSNPPVSDIILSHWHQDHVGGLPSVLKLINKLQGSHHLPNVWKFKSSTHAARINPGKHDQKSQDQWVKHDRDIHQQILDSFHDCISRDDDQHSAKLSQPPQLNWLSNQQVFQLSPNLNLKILHTPGHTDDSICCLLCDDTAGPEKVNQQEMNRAQRPSGILTGDTILGGSSTIFEDLVVYLKSLQSLLDAINPGDNRQPSALETTPVSVPLYPAHGPLIQDGARSIQRLVSHRLDREKQILDIFQHQYEDKSPADPDYYLTAEKLVELIYPSGLPKDVFPAAVHGINQHLKKLKHDGLIDQLESHPRFWFLKTPTKSEN